jgi:hypothetical protein
MRKILFFAQNLPRHQEKCREASLLERTGAKRKRDSAQHKEWCWSRESSMVDQHHPVCAFQRNGTISLRRSHPSSAEEGSHSVAASPR